MEISRSMTFVELFGVPDDIIEPLVPAEAMAAMWAAVDKANHPIDAAKVVIGRNPYAGNPDDDIPAPWWDDGDTDGDTDPPDEAWWPKPF